MSDRAKKIILVVVFLIVTILLGYLLYYLFLVPSPKPTVPNANQLNNGSGLPLAGGNTNRPVYINVNGELIPASDLINIGGEAIIGTPAAESEVKTLVETPSLAATTDATGKNLIYYNKLDGKFYHVDANGKIQAYSDKSFPDVESVYWAPSKEKAILEFPDGANILYNFKTDDQTTLPKYWQDFSFSPDSDKISFKSVTSDKEDRWLAVSNDNGSGSQQVERMGDYYKNVEVNWSPNKQVIATFTEGLDFDRQYLYFVGLNHERFNATIIEGRDYRSQWSPDGLRLLYSAYNTQSNLNPMIWVVDGSGENIGNNRTPLYLNTWADKCTFSDADTVYCAVPKTLEKGSGIIPKVADNTPDDFYKIDLRTNDKILIAATKDGYNAQNLSVSADGKYLYFIDKITGKLEQLKLE